MTEQTGENRQDGTDRTEQTGRNRQDGTDRTALPQHSDNSEVAAQSGTPIPI
jgi:hypothetical protein